MRKRQRPATGTVAVGSATFNKGQASQVFYALCRECYAEVVALLEQLESPDAS